MITRPLNLAAHLRPEPRNFDFLFVVNAGLLVLFFSLLGSRFVLSPGLGLDFEVPAIAGARTGAVATTHVISVKSAGVILVDGGTLDMEQLRQWLKKQGENKSDDKSRPRSLLVIASNTLPLSSLTEITSAARDAGFVSPVQFVAEDTAASKKVGQ